MSNFDQMVSFIEHSMRRTGTQALSAAAAAGESAGAASTASAEASLFLPRTGNTASSFSADADADADADGVLLPTRNAVDTESSTMSPPSHAAARPIFSHRAPCTAIATRPAELAANGFEIIDLCSDSDDDVSLPPSKRPRIDDLVRNRSQGMAVADSEAEAGARTGTVAGMLNCATGMVVDEDAERKAKQEKEEEVVVVVREVGEKNARPEPGAGMSRQHVLKIANADASVESTTVAKQARVPTAEPRRDNEAMRSANTFAAEDVLLVEIRDPGTFTTPRFTKSPVEVKPIQRIEIIRTASGVKKRKMVGPFVVEDDDCLEDEGYGSFSSCAAKDNQMRVGDGDGNGNNNSNGNNSNSNPSLPESCPIISTPTKLDDMEVTQRRRVSEDKCAEASRRMRQEALAKRKTGVQESGRPATGLTKDFLEDESRSRVDVASLTLKPQPAKKGTLTASSVTSPQTMCASKRADLNDGDDDDDEDDDLFANNNDSAEAVESQLDLVQAFANSKDGTIRTAGDLSRSCPPCTSASSRTQQKQKADTYSDVDSQRKGDGGLPLHGSIPPREKQRLCGKERRIATSGTERCDREQVEKYWSRMVRGEGGRKGNQDAEVELELELELAGNGKLPAKDLSVAHSEVIQGAKGKHEARLLAAKEPLRAAPSMSGGLARLAPIAEQKTDTPAHRRGSNDRRSNPTQCSGGSPTPEYPQPGNNTFDEANWTRDAHIRKRKREIDNLMNTWTETAKCWWIVFDATCPRYQKAMGAQVQELRSISDLILRGFSSRDKAERRIKDIKANMTRRARRHQVDNPSNRMPTEQEIDREVVQLMSEERHQKARMMLQRVLDEYERYQQAQKKKRHVKRVRPDLENSCSQNTQPRTLSKSTGEFALKSSSQPGTSDQYEHLKLTHQKRAAWQKEDAKIEQIKERLAIFDQVAEPAQEDGRTKKVRFTDQALWENRFDDTQDSDTESDEDEGETAPSFGRGDGCGADKALRDEPGAGAVARKSVGGKGLLSQLRKGDDLRASDDALVRRQTAKTGLLSQNEPAQNVLEVQNPNSDESSHTGEKSRSLPSQLNYQEQVSVSHQSSEVEDKKSDEADSISEAESSFTGHDDNDAIYDGAHIPEYDIVADYEGFDDYQDAKLVPLGKHIDVRAALRQMRKVATDVAASASRKYRQLRMIWDTDDFELAAQTVILPTGGECRIRMMKCWTLAADWPGKQRAKTAVAPKVFYIVHETKTTSLRSLSDIEEDAEDDDLFGPEDFEDPNAIIEKERDMCFSSRDRANEIAKNRLMAYHRRHEASADTENIPGLTAYMEQIGHDKVCFEQERRCWIENKNARKGKEEIKIWVEEMIADMPHL